MLPLVLRRRPPFRPGLLPGLFRSEPGTDGRRWFRPLSPFGYLAVGLLTAIASWVGLVCLPVDPYARYQWLRDTDYVKGGWIYERLHFDPTPVDVAFLGTSHTLAGVDDRLVEETADAAAPAPVHVVNLALPHYGRDVDYLLARLLFQHKRPKLLVIETDFIEFRVNHPAFPLIADPGDLFGAPVLINTGLLEDITWLPKRKLQIFAADTLGIGPPTPAFYPARYGGPHRNDTYETMMRGGRLSPPRVTHPEEPALRDAAAREVRGAVAKAREYDSLGWIELRYHRHFMRKLLAAAREAGTRVVFLYLPPFGAPDEPRDAAELRREGEVWTVPKAILDDPALWMDKSHLNVHGARKLSAWLGQRIATTEEAAR